MIYLILLIIITTIILYFIYKDYLKVLKITGIVTISSSILTLIVGYFIKYLMNTNLNFINISDITAVIVSKFVLNAIYLLIIGLIESVCYFIIHYTKDKRKVVNNN